MNTVDDVAAELRRLEEQAPSEVDVRSALARGIRGRARRRRAMVAAASTTAVVAVAVGVQAVRAALNPAGERAADRPVVSVSLPPAPIPSALPTATVTLPAAGPTTDVEPVPAELPFGFRHTQRGSYSSWTVTGDSAYGQASIALEGSDVVGGNLQWFREGLPALPADAERMTISGHQAWTWHVSTADGVVTHIGWTLRDGSGLDVFGDAVDVASASEGLASVRAFAAVITNGSIPVVAAVPAPRRTVGDLTQLAVSFTLGGIPSTGSTLPAGWVGSWLCPGGTTALATLPAATCVSLYRGAGALGFGTFGAGAGVASVGGQRLFVSADGSAVTRLGPGGVVDTVTAGLDAPGITSADLAAIVVNIPNR